MIRKLHKKTGAGILVGGLIWLMQSCNKELPNAVPISQPSPSGSSISEVLADPNYSILKAAIDRSAPAASTGLPKLSVSLADKSAIFTFFAPDNNAFIASGIPNTTVINALRTGYLDTILRYHLIGGQTLTSANITQTFPNMYLPSSLILQAPSAAVPPGIRMSVFPSRRGSSVWVNNVPVVQADIAVANGVMHKVAALVAPPSAVLYQNIATDPQLTYFAAAIARADSGQTGLNKFGGADGALAYVPANLTVLAPTNTAFQTTLTGAITLALMAQGMDQATAAATAAALASSPAVFSNPALYGVLTAQTVRGLIAYHLFGARAFSVNLPGSATTVPTLLSLSIPAHPGIKVQASYTGPVVTAATFTSQILNPANGSVTDGPVANLVTKDITAINGVMHKIDAVLFPLPF